MGYDTDLRLGNSNKPEPSEAYLRLQEQRRIERLALHYYRSLKGRSSMEGGTPRTDPESHLAPLRDQGVLTSFKAYERHADIERPLSADERANCEERLTKIRAAIAASPPETDKAKRLLGPPIYHARKQFIDQTRANRKAWLSATLESILWAEKERALLACARENGFPEVASAGLWNTPKKGLQAHLQEAIGKLRAGTEDYFKELGITDSDEDIRGFWLKLVGEEARRYAEPHEDASLPLTLYALEINREKPIKKARKAIADQAALNAKYQAEGDPGVLWANFQEETQIDTRFRLAERSLKEFESSEPPITLEAAPRPQRRPARSAPLQHGEDPLDAAGPVDRLLPSRAAAAGAAATTASQASEFATPKPTSLAGFILQRMQRGGLSERERGDLQNLYQLVLEHGSELLKHETGLLHWSTAGTTLSLVSQQHPTAIILSLVQVLRDAAAEKQLEGWFVSGVLTWVGTGPADLDLMQKVMPVTSPGVTDHKAITITDEATQQVYGGRFFKSALYNKLRRIVESAKAQEESRSGEMPSFSTS